MKTNHRTLTALGAIAGLALAGTTAHASTIVYQDQFNDADGLAANTGIGGGLGSFDRQGGPFLDNGVAGAVLDANRGTAHNNRGNVYSTNAFDLTGGFSLEVRYDTSNLANGRINIGLIDSSHLPAAQDSGNYVTEFLSQNKDKYGIGMSLTVSDSAQGLRFATDAGTGSVTGLSNAQTPTIGLHTFVLEVDSSSNWSYSIDGATATTGTIAGGFDFTRDYQFFTYVQTLTVNKQNDLEIDSVTLSVIPEPSAALLGALGLLGLLRRRR